MTNFNRITAPIFLISFGVITITMSNIMENHYTLVLNSFGVAFLIAGILWIVNDFRFLRQWDILSNEIHMSESNITNQVEAMKSTTSSGMERVYENQSKLLFEYPSIIRETRERVDILGITLISFLWNINFEGPTVEALRRGVRFRLLVLDPDSPVVGFLVKQEQRSYKTFREEFRRSIHVWQKFQKEGLEPGRLQIRIYNDIPISFLMITDERLFFSPYAQARSHLGTPCIEVRVKTGPIYQAYSDHFETLWMQSVELERAKNYGL